MIKSMDNVSKLLFMNNMFVLQCYLLRPVISKKNLMYFFATANKINFSGFGLLQNFAEIS